VTYQSIFRPELFAGQVIIVTGGGSGIGRCTAHELASLGASIALVGRKGEKLAKVAAEIGEDVGQGRASTHVCDIRLEEQVAATVADIVKAHGRIDGLVNNAGIFRAAEFLDVTEEDWDAVIDVNLKGSFLVGQAVARQMAAQGRGAIVNMSSVNGLMAIATIASYNASKGGINQLTRAMSLGLIDHGVRVNAVAPGTIATDLARDAVLTSDAARQRILGRTPMKRLGEPDEIADVVGFLLSDASSYVTGEIVYVDGGRLALNYTVAA
jgi:NAD(P)-dependent dehydrogenase (short-subunit alcohol dehydrogenase family)